MKYFLMVLFCGFLNTPVSSAQVPIVKDKMLLGGAQNGKWLTAQQILPQLKNETEFILVGLKGVEEGGVTLGKRGEESGACPENAVIDLELEIESGIALGSNAAWNPVPRLPKNIALTNPTYQKIVVDFLKIRGIAKTRIKLTQAFRVDLDGDGIEEVLIAANYYRRGMGEQQSTGDYSFVLLRKIVGGKPQNILIDGEFFAGAGEYDPPNLREISPIADLNGDGRMEIVLDVSYYEGRWTNVYELRQNKLAKVLEIECGL
jgi:hypothetical protein